MLMGTAAWPTYLSRENKKLSVLTKGLRCTKLTACIPSNIHCKGAGSLELAQMLTSTPLSRGKLAMNKPVKAAITGLYDDEIIFVSKKYAPPKKSIRFCTHG